MTLALALGEERSVAFTACDFEVWFRYEQALVLL